MVGSPRHSCCHCCDGFSFVVSDRNPIVAPSPPKMRRPEHRGCPMVRTRHCTSFGTVGNPRTIAQKWNDPHVTLAAARFSSNNREGEGEGVRCHHRMQSEKEVTWTAVVEAKIHHRSPIGGETPAPLLGLVEQERERSDRPSIIGNRRRGRRPPSLRRRRSGRSSIGGGRPTQLSRVSLWFTHTCVCADLFKMRGKRNTNSIYS
jgi:hypothetical protein